MKFRRVLHRIEPESISGRNAFHRCAFTHRDELGPPSICNRRMDSNIGASWFETGMKILFFKLLAGTYSDSPNWVTVVFNSAFINKDNISPFIQTPILSSRSKILPLSLLSTSPEELFARFDELKRVAEDLIYRRVTEKSFQLIVCQVCNVAER